MEPSRILDWNRNDDVALFLLCQAEQEWMEMLQNPKIMKQFIMAKRNESGMREKEAASVEIEESRENEAESEDVADTKEVGEPSVESEPANEAFGAAGDAGEGSLGSGEAGKEQDGATED